MRECVFVRAPERWVMEEVEEGDEGRPVTAWGGKVYHCLVFFGRSRAILTTAATPV